MGNGPTERRPWLERAGNHTAWTTLPLLGYKLRMNRSRLISALLASLFALHLTVVGGLAGALSSDGMMAMRQAVPDAGMSDMVAGEPTTEDAPVSDESPCPEEAPCDIPGVPGHCPLLVACALAFPSTGENATIDLLLPARAAVLSSQLPHTRTSPPERRPPRA